MTIAMIFERKISLFALPLALALSACGFSEDNPESLAAEALESGDIGAARLHYAQAIDAQPAKTELRLKYAEALLALGDGVGAQAALEALPQDQRMTGQAASLMGHAKLLQRQAESALTWADNAGADDPLASWVKIGAHLQMEDEDTAVAIADRAVETHPKDARLLALRGEIALGRRQIGPAKTFSDRALDADKGSLEAQTLAGKLDLMREDFAEAEEHFAAAVAINRSIVGPRLSLAAVQADMGKLDEASETLNAAREIAPGHPMGMFLDAKLAFVKGDLDSAHSTMQDAESQLRKVPAAQLLMGEIAHLRGNHEQSIAFLRPFVRNNPGHMQGAIVMAQALVAVGETERAWAVVQTPAKRAAAQPQLLALASRLAQESGRDDPFAARLGSQQPPEDLSQKLSQADAAIAKRDWETARSIYADLRGKGMESNALVLNNGALAELETGNLGQALTLARRAAALTPDDPQVMDTMGWVLLQSKTNNAEALRWLGQARNALPGNLEVRWHYAAALAANGHKAEARKAVRDVREFANAAQREHIDSLLAQL